MGFEKMEFTEAIKTCFSKYVGFSGRASRPEYWWFVLFLFLGSIVFEVLDWSLFGVDPQTGQSQGYLSALFGLVTFLPAMAAGWRRLQDAGRPGWVILLPMLLTFVTMVMVFTGIWAFSIAETRIADPEVLRTPAAFVGGTGILVVTLIQLILWVVTIIWLIKPSDPQDNIYGPKPVR